MGNISFEFFIVILPYLLEGIFMQFLVISISVSETNKTINYTIIKYTRSMTKFLTKEFNSSYFEGFSKLNFSSNLHEKVHRTKRALNG